MIYSEDIRLLPSPEKAIRIFRRRTNARTSDLAELYGMFMQLYEDSIDAKGEITRLTKENERLTKANNRMAARSKNDE